MTLRSYLETQFKTQALFPYIELPLVHKLDTQYKQLLDTIVTDLKQVLRNDTYFIRYDLTLPFIRSNLAARSEIGVVCRIAPSNTYRRIEFIQADMDCIKKSQTTILEIIFATLAFLDSLPVQYTVHYNHIPKFIELMQLQTDIRIWQIKQDRQARYNQIPSAPIVLQNYIKVTYPTLYNHPRCILNTSIVRGLHMYTGLVYQIAFNGCKYAMGGGGEYAIQKLSPHEYAGGSLGLSRIETYLQLNLMPIPLIICSKDYLDCYVPHPLLKKTIKPIAKYRIIRMYQDYPYLVFVDKQEYITHTYTMRNMQTGALQTLSSTQLLQLLQNACYFKKR